MLKSNHRFNNYYSHIIIKNIIFYIKFGVQCCLYKLLLNYAMISLIQNKILNNMKLRIKKNETNYTKFY